MKGFIQSHSKYFFPAYVLLFLAPFYGMPPYYDDLHRFSSNTTNLANQGRLLTEWLYTSIQFFEFNAFPDLYYFGLVFIASISIASYALARKITGRDGEDYVMWFFLSIFSMPGIIQNISFHVDCIGMFMSLYLSVIAGMIVNKGKLSHIATSTTLLCFATLFYQFSFNYYIISSAAFLFIHISTGKVSGLKGACLHAAIKIPALIISIGLSLLVKSIFIRDKYFLDHSRFSTIQELIDGRLSRNIGKFQYILENTFSRMENLTISILFIVFMISLVICVIKLCKEKKLYVAVLVSILPLIALAMVLLPGVLIFNPVIEQRTLAMSGLLLFCFIAPGIYVKKIYPVAFVLASMVMAFNLMTVSAFTSAQRYAVDKTRVYMDRLYLTSPEEYFGKDGKLKIGISMQERPTHTGTAKRNIEYFPSIKFMVMDYFWTPYQMAAFNRYFNTGVDVHMLGKSCSKERKQVARKDGFTTYECDGILWAKFN